MKLIRNISFITLLLLYISAGLGYGLHKCSVDGSITPVLMIHEASCERVHSHSHSSDCSGQCSSHDCSHGGCCHTEVFQLDDNYDAIASFQIEQPTEFLLHILLLNNINTLDFSDPSEDLICFSEYSPPEPVPDSFQSKISVWRL